MNFDRPIINIGLGRSGSTLFAGILDHHPKISYGFETHFLAPRLWNLFMHGADAIPPFVGWRYNWEIWHKKIKGCLGDNYSRTDFCTLEQKRIGSHLAQFIFEILGLDSHCTQWGYKEIWNGIDNTTYFPWLIYDNIFPNAYWVHIVRNPIDFARSHWLRIKSKEDTFTKQVLMGELQKWVSCVLHSQARATNAKYYFEFKYEDIISDAKRTLQPIFDALELDWSTACEDALSIKYCPTDHGALKTEDFFQSIEGDIYIPDLYPLLCQYNYNDILNSYGINILPFPPLL